MGRSRINRLYKNYVVERLVKCDIVNIDKIYSTGRVSKIIFNVVNGQIFGKID